MPSSTGEARLDVQMKQGHPPFGVEMKITDDAGKRAAVGRQDLRPAEGARAGGGASAYYKEDGDQVLDEDGFFDTGDVATIDRYGYMQITDRAKDVIKSGGEWISSIDLENLAVGHPKVAEAAVIGVRASEMGRAAAAGHRAQEGRDAPPRTTSSASCRARSPNGGCRTTSCSSTKSRTPRPARSRRLALREQFKDYRLPTAQAAE